MENTGNSRKITLIYVRSFTCDLFSNFTNIYYLRLLISSATDLIILQDTAYTYLRL